MEIVFVLAFVTLWFLPTIYAFQKKMSNKWNVFTTNFFLIYTVIGPLIQIRYVMRAYKRSIRLDKEYRISLEKNFSDHIFGRNEFLNRYAVAKDRWELENQKKLSKEERELDFFKNFPDANLFRAPINARDFEFIAESWMKYWGLLDSVVTQASGDGGIDVLSSRFAAQVKFFADFPVGRPDVQKLYGAAQALGLATIFFAYTNGYTKEALEWADSVEMACFTFVPVSPGDSRFEFQGNTNAAADLMLENEGMNYSEYQERVEMEHKYISYMNFDEDQRREEIGRSHRLGSLTEDRQVAHPSFVILPLAGKLIQKTSSLLWPTIDED